MTVRSAILAILLALLVGGDPAAAQPANVAAIAAYRGEDRQSLLESGARREGRLLLYTVGTQIDPLMDRFGRKYPFIKLELYRADSTTIARRIVEEYGAGLYQADGFELSSEGLILPREKGILEPFHSPEEGHYQPSAIEPVHRWISVRESYGGIGYNTALIAASQAPRLWTDLVRPEFKGKMGISGSPSVTAHWIGLLLLTYGRGLLDRLAGQDIRVYGISSRAVANLTISGEVAIAVRASNAHFAESRAKGAPVAWVAPGPVAVDDTVVAITARAPHPDAMMLMIDFLLSREGQAIYRDLGYDSARDDMAGAERPPEKLYFGNRPNFFAEYEEWVELFNTIFAHRP
jgi:iron(III) transport system substrate-binding protein